MAYKRYTAAERMLLRETCRFMRARTYELQAMLEPARELRVRLSQTAAYRRVDGLDHAESALTFDLAGTLGTCFEPAVTDMIHNLRDAVARCRRRLRKSRKHGRRRKR